MSHLNPCWCWTGTRYKYWSALSKIVSCFQLDFFWYWKRIQWTYLLGELFNKVVNHCYLVNIVGSAGKRNFFLPAKPSNQLCVLSLELINGCNAIHPITDEQDRHSLLLFLYQVGGHGTRYIIKKPSGLLHLTKNIS